jgi:hypothetical protein
MLYPYKSVYYFSVCNFLHIYLLYLYLLLCVRSMVTVTEYILYCKRANLFLSSSIILTPHPSLLSASVYPPPPPAFVAGGGQTRRAERGMGGQYFGRREKMDCSLKVKYVLYGDSVSLWIEKGLLIYSFYTN